ncbi:MAG: putative metal-binding motif-containing protein, partial [Candidatus Woesearchaeota archaeon]
MMKAALLSAILVLLVGIAHAENAAYVLRNPAIPDQKIVSVLEQSGFTVTLIDDNNAASTDFSNYHLIVLGDESLSDPFSIPVRQRPSVIVSHYYLDIWGIAQGASSYSVGNNYIKGKVMINNTITTGLPQTVQLYNSIGGTVYQLPKLPDRSRDLDNLVANTNDNAYSLVGIIDKGDRLYGSGTALARSCFIGMTDTTKWTIDSEKIFSRCARYVIVGLDMDQDGFPAENDCNDYNPGINPSMPEIVYNSLDDDCNPATLDDDLDLDSYKRIADCNDANSSINPGALDIAYNLIDEDCSGYDLADVDLDGYCKAGYQIINKSQCSKETGAAGTDCNDSAKSTYPGAMEVPYDSIDQDCSGNDLVDVDSDGYDYTIDCNDNNPQVNPGKIEVPYNGLDDDCNTSTYDNDLDRDGFLLADDCDDKNALINPGIAEKTYNSIDDDCNPLTLDDDLDS